MNTSSASIKHHIQSCVQSDTLSHATLLYGERAPTKLARQLIKEMFNLVDDSAFHPDLMRIDTDDSIKIDSIRKVQSFMSATPHQARFRVVLVEDAERMTLQAANAFLKILEEPPGARYIIMSAAQISKLPATVLSRCQKYYCSDSTQNDPALDKSYAQLLKLFEPRCDFLSMLSDVEKKAPEQMMNALMQLVLDMCMHLQGLHIERLQKVMTESLQAKLAQLELKQLLNFYDVIKEQKRTAIERLDYLLMTFYGELLGNYDR